MNPKTIINVCLATMLSTSAAGAARAGAKVGFHFSHGAHSEDADPHVFVCGQTPDQFPDLVKVWSLAVPRVVYLYSTIDNDGHPIAVVDAAIHVPLPDPSKVKGDVPDPAAFVEVAYWRIFAGPLAEVDRVCARANEAVHEELVTSARYRQFAPKAQ